MESVEDIVLGLLDPLSALKRLPRTGWLLAGVAQPESVADHSYATALLAYCLADLINRDPEDQGLGAHLDTGRVMAIALVHDLAESILTDLPRRASQLLGAQAKHAAEARALQDLFGGLDGESSYLALWREYDEAVTPESRVVRDADKLEVVHQALVYEQSGQRNLGEFWEGHRWHYPVSLRVFEGLQRRRTELK